MDRLGWTIWLMDFKCSIGLHDWSANCERCRRCDARRSGRHQWDNCRCKVCGKERTHQWDGCKCCECCKTRDAEHRWDRCHCIVCGATEYAKHIWTGDACGVCGTQRCPADIWASQLAEEGKYSELVILCTRASYQLSESEVERKRFAREALLAAGEKAVDAIGAKVLTGGAVSTLAEILMASNSRNAIPPLLARFRDFGGGNSNVTDDIVAFFARMGAVETAQGLEAFLEDRNVYTRYSAAYGLGLLAVPGTTDALQRALDGYGASIRHGLLASQTEFARSVVASYDERRRTVGVDLVRMADTDILDVLRDFCAALSRDDDQAIGQLEVRVRDIGEELYHRGREGEMKRILHELLAIPQYRRIEAIWSGIGDWRG